ncbi:helix-turn-helix domain-containing protein [Blautia pseudococcoides]|nr:helix-turn-helix domain-containing protein [Blautia pseudococcoides]
MNFENKLLKARESDKEAMREIIDMYRPLMIKYAVVNDRFDEDLYQEFIYTLLLCIKKFPYQKYVLNERGDNI